VTIRSNVVLAPASDRETFGQITATLLKDEVTCSPVVQRAWAIVQFVNDCFYCLAYLFKRFERAALNRLRKKSGFCYAPELPAGIMEASLLDFLR
jgi:hypothetical protein